MNLSDAPDCLSATPRGWLWPALAVTLVAASLVTGAAALAQPPPAQPSDTSPYAALLTRVKQDEEHARAEIAYAVRTAGSDRALANALVAIAGRRRMAGESTRQAYLGAVEQLEDARQRGRALRTLLAKAPITERTGRAVLRAAAGGGDDRELGRVLSYFHRTRERALLRGPLAMDYLDAAERLRSERALGDALRRLLHGRELLGTGPLVRALQLAERLGSDRTRLAVLRELTDHQPLTGPVVRAYGEVVDRLGSDSARHKAIARLEAAGATLEEGTSLLTMVRDARDWVEARTRRFELQLRRLNDRVRGVVGVDLARWGMPIA